MTSGWLSKYSSQSTDRQLTILSIEHSSQTISCSEVRITISDNSSQILLNVNKSLSIFYYRLSRDSVWMQLLLVVFKMQLSIFPWYDSLIKLSCILTMLYYVRHLETCLLNWYITSPLFFLSSSSITSITSITPITPPLSAPSTPHWRDPASRQMVLAPYYTAHFPGTESICRGSRSVITWLITI